MADDLEEIKFADLPAKKGSITLAEEKTEDKENTDTTAPSAEEVAMIFLLKLYFVRTE